MSHVGEAETLLEGAGYALGRFEDSGNQGSMVVAQVLSLQAMANAMLEVADAIDRATEALRRTG